MAGEDERGVGGRGIGVQGGVGGMRFMCNGCREPHECRLSSGILFVTLQIVRHCLLPLSITLIRYHYAIHFHCHCFQATPSYKYRCHRASNVWSPTEVVPLSSLLMSLQLPLFVSAREHRHLLANTSYLIVRACGGYLHDSCVVVNSVIARSRTAQHIVANMVAKRNQEEQQIASRSKHRSPLDVDVV